jgi:hypothetical protein
MRNSMMCVAAVVAILFAGAKQARAQGAPTAEGALGYAYMHDEELSIGFPFGWMASVAGNATSWLALVGEVGGSYKKYTLGATELQLRVHTFTVGPRLTVTATSPIAPFAQLLFGIAHGSADFGAPGLNVVVSGTSFATQLGFGIDLNASPSRALRLQLDLRGLRDNDQTTGQWRLVAAAVFRN